MSTREDEPFLVLNGIQTQSARTLNLVSELDDLKKLQVDVLRISPQSRHTEAIIEAFHLCLQGSITATEAETQLDKLMPVGPCNGYWFGDAGMDDARQQAAL